MLRITSILFTVCLLFSAQTFADIIPSSANHTQLQRFDQLTLNDNANATVDDKAVNSSFNAALKGITALINNPNYAVTDKQGTDPQINIHGTEVSLNNLYRSLKAAHDDLVAQTGATSTLSEKNSFSTALHKAYTSLRKTFSFLPGISSPTLDSAKDAIQAAGEQAENAARESLGQQPVTLNNSEDATSLSAEISALEQKGAASETTLQSLESQEAVAQTALAAAKAWSPNEAETTQINAATKDLAAKQAAYAEAKKNLDAAQAKIKGLSLSDELSSKFEGMANDQIYFEDRYKSVQKVALAKKQFEAQKATLSDEEFEKYNTDYKPLYDALNEAKKSELKASRSLGTAETTYDKVTLSHSRNTHAQAAQSTVDTLAKQLETVKNEIKQNSGDLAAYKKLVNEPSAIRAYNNLAQVREKLQPLLDIEKTLRYGNVNRMDLLNTLEAYYSVKTEPEMPEKARNVLKNSNNARDVDNFIERELVRHKYPILLKSWKDTVAAATPVTSTATVDHTDPVSDNSGSHFHGHTHTVDDPHPDYERPRTPPVIPRENPSSTDHAPPPSIHDE